MRTQLLLPPTLHDWMRYLRKILSLPPKDLSQIVFHAHGARKTYARELCDALGLDFGREIPREPGVVADTVAQLDTEWDELSSYEGLVYLPPLTSERSTEIFPDLDVRTRIEFDVGESATFPDIEDLLIEMREDRGWEKRVVVHMGSEHAVHGTSWCMHAREWIKLLREIPPSVEIVLVGTSHQRALAREISEFVPCTNLVQITTFPDLILLLEACDGYLGYRSGLSFIAAGQGVPAISIFPEEEEERMGTWFTKEEYEDQLSREWSERRGIEPVVGDLVSLLSVASDDEIKDEQVDPTEQE